MLFRDDIKFNRLTIFKTKKSQQTQNHCGKGLEKYIPQSILPPIKKNLVVNGSFLNSCYMFLILLKYNFYINILKVYSLVSLVILALLFLNSPCDIIYLS